MKKKFFAVFMCLIMVLVFMPSMAWAEGETQTEYGLLGDAEAREYYFYATDTEDTVHGPLVIQVDVAEAKPQPPVTPVWLSAPGTTGPLRQQRLRQLLL